MIKFTATAKDGTTIVGLGLSEGNIKKLKQGQPMVIHLEELGIEGIDVLVHYGETEEAILAEFKRVGLI